MPLVIEQELRTFAAALKLHQAGRAAEAEVAYRQTLAMNPNNPDALHMLGVLLHQHGHTQQALPLVARAAALQPNNADIFVNLAELQRCVGQVEAGLQSARRAVEIAPANASAHVNVAALLRAAGRPDEALISAQKAMQLNPSMAIAYTHAGCCLFDKNPAAALPCFLKATELEPANADTLSTLGVCLEKLGRHEEALACQQRALPMAPNNFAILRNLGSALANLGRYPEALPAFERAVALNPDDELALLNYAACLHRTKQFDKALQVSQQTARKFPHNSDPYSLIADALSTFGRFDEAVAAIEKGLAIAPSGRLYHSLGIALIRGGRAAEGLAALEKSLAMDPTPPTLHFDISVARLMLGKYAEAWPEYEWRWKHPGLRNSAVNFKEPKWDGSPLNGKRILLYGEQGLGDTVFFGRYATRVAEQMGGYVILCAQPPLVDLVKSIRGVSEVTSSGVPLPPFDTHYPIMSLPGMFKTTLENVPNTVPYIAADPARVAHWKQRLAASRNRFRVGLVWEGGAFQAENFLRSASLAAFSPLAQVPGVSFYSLQKGPAADQAKPPRLPEAWRSPAADFTDLDADIHDFSDTAAILQNMDLLISIDTSVVHVAGALAKPVWMLLAFSPGHMWMLNRPDSPWYPTFTLFRQPAYQDWATPVGVLAEKLRALVGS
ncbi:MAG TPA: tetratricopeptide repeat protein [Phycisphaerae bacterium]|nr:tetratricopeptide repeat protein [Phycisphaerae bacterium]